ncbi:endonuclease/exonuclease/phosphatase family protein [Virgibacillus xinjiangensis]|uniref:Endonuclease/exonuclease/phosphatase family protein n=1 Tax=Virgibacillus xinjiangensis TaxID=393090 RepID=A0ABV7CWH4_9BACI
MKRIYLLLSVLIAMVFLGSHAVGAQKADHSRGTTEKVKVMSYNMHHAVGEDNRLDLERIAEVIEDADADIIGLQEVDHHWSARSDFKDQAKLLADRLDMFYTYAANLDVEPAEEGEPRRQYGTAILSKYPILTSENYPLTRLGNTEQRGLLEAVINVKGNHVHVFNTHLALTPEERELQIQEVVDIAEQSKGPQVIMGDLNAIPESDEMVPMYAHYKDAFSGQDDAYTYSAANPTKRIDYIFTSEDLGVQNSRVIDTLASDHLPITTEILLDGPYTYYR